MTIKTKNWVLGVSGTVVGSIICFFLILWWGHFDATAENARATEENAKRAEKTAEIQTKLVEIVDRLSEIHEVKDAGLEKVAELCRAGKLDDCDDCAEAGIELKKCVE